MNDTWIKLYRKIVHHDVFQDESAFRVFMWILCMVDYKTGTMRFGRFWASEILNINPNTLYSIIQRLQKKYEIINIKSNNKNSVISVLNWSKYQLDDEDINNTGNNKSTTNQQQINNKSTLLNNIRNKELRNNKKEIYKEKGKFTSIDDILEVDIEQIANDYSVNIGYVKLNLEQMKNWCKAKGRSYKDYKHALRNWVLKDMKSQVEKRREQSKVYDATDIG